MAVESDERRACFSFRLWHTLRKTRRRRKRRRESEAELSETFGSKHHRGKKYQLSFHVQQALHNCITDPLILATMTDCISSILFTFAPHIVSARSDSC